MVLTVVEIKSKLSPFQQIWQSSFNHLRQCKWYRKTIILQKQVHNMVFSRCPETNRELKRAWRQKWTWVFQLLSQSSCMSCWRCKTIPNHAVLKEGHIFTKHRRNQKSKVSFKERNHCHQLTHIIQFIHEPTLNFKTLSLSQNHTVVLLCYINSWIKRNNRTVALFIVVPGCVIL